METLAGIAFLPILATIGFYLLPSHWQGSLLLQFFPQTVAFACLGVWVLSNQEIPFRLGLKRNLISQGLRYGMMTGCILGMVNTAVILNLVPAMGGEIDFLRHTPHARVPFWLMVPWFIVGIAVMVELNFRGFLLGRLIEVFGKLNARGPSHVQPMNDSPFYVPLGLSAATFAFDPFMVNTFQHLHWIALWDGLVWGWLMIRLRNLYAVMTAHAVEVLILYLCIRTALA